MKNTLYIAVLFLMWQAISCVKAPNYPDEPFIEFVSFSNDSIRQDVDFTDITFSFEDGNGDIGALSADSSARNIILTDTRSGFEEFYKMPFIPKQGVADGISGEVTINVRANCCTPQPNSAPCTSTPGQAPEGIIYSIQVFDQAGNLSNIIETTAIIHLCEF